MDESISRHHGLHSPLTVLVLLISRIYHLYWFLVYVFARLCVCIGMCVCVFVSTLTLGYVLTCVSHRMVIYVSLSHAPSLYFLSQDLSMIPLDCLARPYTLPVCLPSFHITAICTAPGLLPMLGS